MNTDFQIFGVSHIIVFVFILLLSIASVLFVRFKKISLANMRLVLFCLSITVYIFFYFSKYNLGWLDIRTDLPMHLCDWAFICSIICLVKPKQYLFELSYFWGLGGTLQAILTPDLNSDFPDISFFIFFSTHIMIIVNIIFFVFSMKLRPYPVSILRVFLFSQLYFIFALIVNIFFDSNYGFIMEKPENPSLLDFLGPHPWYLLELQFVAIISFTIYYSPFYIKDKILLKRS